ncbi:MAG TPA: S53 family peptidase [Solirubrobacteraceae bacterium]|nr:S53 family peptidase [Solirubrobacteraceae bacterium]
MRASVLALGTVTAALAAAVFASLLSATPATAATPSFPGAPTTRYAQVERVCAAPKPGDASCLALRLIPARAGEKGAAPYLSAAGDRSSGPAGGLTPGDLASAYDFNPSSGGGGQTVALVDAYNDPDIEADLGTFDSQYALPACTTADGCFEKVGQSGSETALPPDDTNGWSVEITLDVETVHSVCQACRIILVEANSEELGDLAASVNEAVALGANEVSNSYAAFETEFGASEAAAYDHPGTVVTAAAGDSGFLNWDDLFSLGTAPEQPDAPASLPTVVAVGGTTLKLSSSGKRKSERVWNDSGLPTREEFKQFSASGGGCSSLFSAPAWQREASGWSTTGCGSKRLDNDISAVADPYTGFDIYDTYQYEKAFTPGWLTVGGTSLSSPLIAGLYALAGGGHGRSYPASELYEHLGQPAALYDVASGGNGYCDGEENGPCEEPAVNELFGVLDCEGTAACDARPGYDGPSGVGAPIGLTAFGGVEVTKPTVTTAAATAVASTSATLNATVNPNGTDVTTCTFEYGPTTAYGSSAPCAIAPGEGKTAVAVSAPIASLLPKMTYHFRVLATNAAGTSDGKDKHFKTKA